MHQAVQHSTIVRSAHTVFMCFVFIWEQTAICATYSINWLVFITEMKSVYSAVRTGSLNKAYWLRDAPTSSTLNNCTICPHCIYVFCIYLRTNSDLCHLQHKLIGFYNRYEKCLQGGTDWVFKYSLLSTWCTNQFNTQQLYDLPTLYLCVLYLSENKQRFVPLTA